MNELKTFRSLSQTSSVDSKSDESRIRSEFYRIWAGFLTLAHQRIVRHPEYDTKRECNQDTHSEEFKKSPLVRGAEPRIRFSGRNQILATCLVFSGIYGRLEEKIIPNHRQLDKSLKHALKQHSLSIELDLILNRIICSDLLG